MKIENKRIRKAATAFAALWVLAAVTHVTAQENLVALGAVDSGGALSNSANTLSGIVASVRNAEGDYTVTVTATGAFTGAAIGDFQVETTVRNSASSDRIVNGQVVAVTDDVLTATVRSADVETISSPTIAETKDAAFFFLIRRIDPLATTGDSKSRHLIALGRVNAAGTTVSSFGVGGIVPSSVRVNPGDYVLTLTKVGEFVGDAATDYVLLLSTIGASGSDKTTKGAVLSTTSDDSLAINVQTDDVQAAAGADTPTLSSNAFSFAVYKINSDDATGAPSSTLVKAVASVGSTGTLTFGQSIFPGATVTSSKTGAGEYDVNINAPGVFTGAAATRYVPMAYVRSNALVDESAKTDIEFVDGDNIRIAVSTDDVQATGQSAGVPTDRAFFVTLYDTLGGFSQDLSLSRSAIPATLVGQGVINANGAGQTVSLNLPGVSARKVFFRSENLGRSVDSLTLRGQGIARPLDARFFRTTGGRVNVTAQVRTGAVVASDMRPGDTVSFEGSFRYTRSFNRPGRAVKMLAGSTALTSAIDVNRVVTKPK